MNSLQTRNYPGLRRKRYRLRRGIYQENQALAPESAGDGEGMISKVAFDELDASRKKIAQQAHALQDQLLRARADYDNFRKRIQQQQKALEESAAERVVQPLLNVIDHFSLALKNSDNIQNINSFVEGVNIIYREMEKVLGDIGLKSIPAEGQPFDPFQHEAVGVIAKDDVPENTVIAEARRGYKLGDRVIRPSLVHVSKKPES